jgi:adenylate cyclase
MAQEIERKFLVVNDHWRALATGERYCQGYLATAKPGQSVRVRIVAEQGYLTLKGPTQGLTRAEFEYAIPLADAQEMLETLCDRPFIEKNRYRLPIGNLLWEIDEFTGENAGLIVAEVELTSEDQPFEKPDWLGAEVSGEARYYNASLVKNPYSKWSSSELSSGSASGSV